MLTDDQLEDFVRFEFHGIGRDASQVMDAVASKLRRHDHLRTSMLVGGTVVVAGALAVAGALVISPSDTAGSHEGNRAAPGASIVRARLLEALTASGDDVLQVQVNDTSDSPNALTCSATQWLSPFDVQSGQQFQEHVKSSCANGSISESAIDIPRPFVAEMATSSGSAPKDTIFRGLLGDSVCGIGDVTGYSTGFAEGNGAYQASSVTLDTQAYGSPSLLRSEVSSRVLRVVGNTTLHGEAAIELSVTPPAADQLPSNWGSETWWVDPSTYLPIEEVLTWIPQPLPSGATEPFPSPTYGSEETYQFSFLSPTPSNLALLQLSVPSGLAHVAAPQVRPAGWCTLLSGG